MVAPRLPIPGSDTRNQRPETCSGQPDAQARGTANDGKAGPRSGKPGAKNPPLRLCDCRRLPRDEVCEGAPDGSVLE